VDYSNLRIATETQILSISRCPISAPLARHDTPRGRMRPASLRSQATGFRGQGSARTAAHLLTPHSDLLDPSWHATADCVSWRVVCLMQQIAPASRSVHVSPGGALFHGPTDTSLVRWAEHAR